jgi:hypothetical protein
MSFVDGFMWAVTTLDGEEAEPAKPKQRRARRKKADIVTAKDIMEAKALAKSAGVASTKYEEVLAKTAPIDPMRYQD